MDHYRLKELADDNLFMDQMIIFLFERIENIVGKGENAGYKHSVFTHFRTIFTYDNLRLHNIQIRAGFANCQKPQGKT